MDLFAYPIMWLHVVAAIFWVGGQLFLVLVVLPVLRQEMAEADRVRVVSRVGRRFALLSSVALAVILVTGPLNAIEHGLSWSILRDTQWGHILVAKVLLVIVMLGLTGVHGAYYGRRLEQLGTTGNTTPADRARRRDLQRQSARLSALNLVLNLTIVSLAVWLSRLP